MKALDISLVVANLVTSGTFVHYLLTVRKYFVVQRTPLSQKADELDVRTLEWGIEGG